MNEIKLDNSNVETVTNTESKQSQGMKTLLKIHNEVLIDTCILANAREFHRKDIIPNAIDRLAGLENDFERCLVELDMSETLKFILADLHGEIITLRRSLYWAHVAHVMEGSSKVQSKKIESKLNGLVEDFERILEVTS